MLYLAELPTIEDIREYNFGSIKKSTPKQREIIREYVKRMNI